MLFYHIYSTNGFLKHYPLTPNQSPCLILSSTIIRLFTLGFPMPVPNATATPSSLAPVKSRKVYLSGAGLRRLSWKKGRKMDVVVVVVVKHAHNTIVLTLNSVSTKLTQAIHHRRTMTFNKYLLNDPCVCTARKQSSQYLEKYLSWRPRVCSRHTTNVMTIFQVYAGQSAGKLAQVNINNPVKNRRILLKQSFTAHMSLQTACGLRKRCYVLNGVIYTVSVL